MPRRRVEYLLALAPLVFGCGVDGRLLAALAANAGGEGGAAGAEEAGASGDRNGEAGERSEGGEAGAPEANGTAGAGDGGLGAEGGEAGADPNGGVGGLVTGGGGSAGSSGAIAGGSSGGGGDAGGGESGSLSTGGGGAGAGAGGAGTGGGPTRPPCGDLNQDSIDDCVQTILTNAGFDHDLEGWSAERQTTISWEPRDSAEDPASGAVAVTFTASGGTGTSMGGINQCIPNVHVAYYEVGTRFFVNGPTEGWGTVNLLFYGGENCEGAQSFSVTLPAILAADSWSEATERLQVPPQVRSLLVRLVVVKPDSEPSLTVTFDSVLARPR